MIRRCPDVIAPGAGPDSLGAHTPRPRSLRGVPLLLAVTVALAALLLGPALASAAAPTSLGAPVIVGAPTEGQQLSATPGLWDNTANAPSTLSYQWERCSTTCINIPYAVESGYVPSRADVGSMLEVAVTATGAGGSTTLASTPLGPIASNGVAAYYVDGSSVGGACSDSATPTQAQSPATPWCSITHAVSALATSTAGADIVVRAGTYTGTGWNGQINLTNDTPAGMVTLEPYGTATQADTVIVKDVVADNTSDYTIEGFDLADPSLPNGCPYITTQDMMNGSLPAQDYCLPATTNQIEAGTTNLNFYDDNFVSQVYGAGTNGVGCPGSCQASRNITIYGSRFHNTGYNCQPYTGMTLSAPVTAGTPITAIPVTSNGVSSTIPAGANVMIYTGPGNSPSTSDTFTAAAGSTSTSVAVSSYTPANTYPAGTAVGAERCPNGALMVQFLGDLGAGFTSTTFNHDQFDQANCSAIFLTGNSDVVENTTFDYLESASNSSCHTETVADEALTNFTYANNLVYNVGIGVIALCNAGGQVACGSNLTIADNVMIGCGAYCISIGNYVGGTNYIVGNTLWKCGTGCGGELTLRWSDSCCTTGYGKDVIENNIMNILGDGETGTTGAAVNEIQTEDYNLIAGVSSDRSNGGHDILGRQPTFATGIGTNCGGGAYDSTGCGTNSTGFNAALLSGSPGIGAGTAGTMIPASDILGNARGLTYDMGAFQADADAHPSNGSGGGSGGSTGSGGSSAGSAGGSSGGSTGSGASGGSAGSGSTGDAGGSAQSGSARSGEAAAAPSASVGVPTRSSDPKATAASALRLTLSSARVTPGNRSASLVVSCSRACAVAATVTVRLPCPRAHRSGCRARTVVLRAGRPTNRAGVALVQIALPRQVQAELRHDRHLNAVVTLQARGLASTISRRLTLRL